MSIPWVMGIALVAVIGAQFLRRFAPESAQLLPLMAIILLFLALLPQLSSVVSAIQQLGNRAGVPEDSLGLILRGVGIGLVTRIAAGICNDCGQRALGETVDYCGQIIIVSMAVPLILDLAQRILETDF